MSEEGKDLFGKIDALFEKRAADALVDKGLEYEDFPLLTEVVAPAPSASAWDGVERRGKEHPQEERRQADRRQDGRRLGDRSGHAEPSARELERLVRAMEQRLTELFIRQQLRLEEVVRKVVREELGPGGDKQ